MTPEQLAKSGTEDGHQAALFCKVAQNLRTYPELAWFHAIPNGGNRNKITASKMKATGTKAGVLDCFLPVPYDDEEFQFHGLYIEMKKPGLENRKNGGMSDLQVQFKAHATFWDYAVAICYTWEEAWHVLETYVRCGVRPGMRETYQGVMEQYK